MILFKFVAAMGALAIRKRKIASAIEHVSLAGALNGLQPDVHMRSQSQGKVCQSGPPKKKNNSTQAQQQQHRFPAKHTIFTTSFEVSSCASQTAGHQCHDVPDDVSLGIKQLET